MLQIYNYYSVKITRSNNFIQNFFTVYIAIGTHNVIIISLLPAALQLFLAF